MSRLSPKLYTWLVGLFASLGSVLFGYDLGVIAAILPSPDFKLTMGPRINDRNQEGLVTSLLVLGAFFASPVAGWSGDLIGRRLAIIAGCITFIVGGVLQTAAQNIEMMMAGRFFAGAGIGQLAMLVPLYQSEISQPSIRGSLITLQQFMLGIGAIIATWVGYACVKDAYAEPLAWRLPLGLQLLPCIPLMLCIPLFPESPRWLAYKGRNEEALQTLARLHARGDTNDPLVQAEYEEIQIALREEHSDENTVKQLFTNKAYFRPLLLGIALQFSVQMTGVSAIQYYSPQIFASVGFSTERTLLFQGFNSIIALAGELACVLFVDKLGRRWPLIISNGMASATFACGTAIIAIFPASSDNGSAHIAFIMMTWIYNFFFSAGIGPIAWAYPTEVFPTHLRSTGVAMTSMSSWISNFLIAQITPYAFDNIGWRYYLVFCILSATNAVFFWAFLPETKGRPLEEMHIIFRDDSIFVPGSKIAARGKHEAEERFRRGELVTARDSHKVSDKLGDEKIDRINSA
ncbi:general substrate transporter [Cystobasidium minutum MCA 4210]|uniref:general substrate transporter n=1 Tax=Cystobasidium minutum MCA 4210 TaxID=1397322 RepID=UPI0034CF183D|eukprot:jgi/Rhomi1/177041/fgenesh1_pg.1_\